MASNIRPSIQKRQREQAQRERAQAKAERRKERAEQRGTRPDDEPEVGGDPDQAVVAASAEAGPRPQG
ncbi:MAG: hypothetical protein IT371_26185 [Deltaproteobacteria bacterium]|nr:hypothetical protein [Deltaproteobacteria bacterium]